MSLKISEKRRALELVRKTDRSDDENELIVVSEMIRNMALKKEYRGVRLGIVKLSELLDKIQNKK